MPHFTTGDGVQIAYDDTGGDRPPLVLLHGWGFSRRFFGGVTPALAEHARVIAVDLRGHGDSGPPPYAPRVARLGADLHELLEHLGLHGATVLGWSLGCAAVWSRFENLGTDRVSGAIFCSQVPRQYLAEDWPWHHAQCYDDAGLARFATRVRYDLPAMINEQTDEIAAQPVSEADRALWTTEMAKCSAETRIAIMADHTRHDWRDLLPTLDLPVLIMQGRQDRAYDWRGVAWIADHVPGARLELFENSAHAIFHDEPERFVSTVIGFMVADHDEGRGRP